MIRPGVWLSVAAVALAVLTAVVIRITASDGIDAVNALVAVMLLAHAALVLIGSSRWIGLTSIPVVVAVMVEAGLATQPAWTRSIVIGVLWFLTMEVSWEAIDRRSGVSYTEAATRRRLQEVVSVVGVALAVGFVATAATTIAPVRSVALQAIVVGALLFAFVSLIRQVRAS